MTYFPDYLKTYPNKDTESSLHISLNALPRGFRRHRHDFLEFSYVVDGAGAETINDSLHRMTPGTFTFVLPYQVHELFTAPGSTLRLYNCMFGMDLLMEGAHRPLLGLIEQNAALPYVQLNGGANDRMRLLVEELYREYNGNEPWRSTMLQIRLKEILILFDRARRATGETAAPELSATGGRRASVWPIIHYIHRHYREDITLADLAGRFSISASRISEVIKETTGQTFLRFLHDLRIRHACGLLVSTELSVAEIALEVGYGSYNTFSRVFRETKGIVPKEYRKHKIVDTLPLS